jgi:hypothetical protein
MNATKMKQLILSIHDSNMAGVCGAGIFISRGQQADHTLLVASNSSKDPLEIDPLDGLRSGEDIYDALCSMLDNCGYHLGDQAISAIAEKIAKLDVAIARQFSEPSEPAPTSAQEREFYRRVVGGPVTILRARSLRQSPTKQPPEE